MLARHVLPSHQSELSLSPSVHWVCVEVLMQGRAYIFGGSRFEACFQDQMFRIAQQQDQNASQEEM